MTCGITGLRITTTLPWSNRDARLLGKLGIGDDAAGLQDLLRLLAEYGDSPDDPAPIAIETSRGLLVACLRASGRQVYAINPIRSRRIPA